MSRVRDAAVQWASLHIQKEFPQEQQAEQLAESLIAIAEEHSVPTSQVVEWIHHAKEHGEISQRKFTHWAIAYETLAAQRLLAEMGGRCGHCGAELHSVEEANAHQCGVQQ